MKVIISTRAIYPFHGFGGMERYFFQLGRHLVKLGVEVEIVASPIKSGEKKAALDGINFTFLPPDMSNKITMHAIYWVFNRNVQRYLESKDFDILHGCGGVYPYVLKKKRKPVVYQPFGMEPFKSRNVAKYIYYYLTHYNRARKIFASADAIASEGDIQTGEMVGLFGEKIRDKIFNLPDGVELDEVRKNADNSNTFRKELGIDEKCLVLINVNRLASNKGVNYLIDALKLIQEKIDVRLILIGDGPEEQRIKAQINKLHLNNTVIHFKGISDEKMFKLLSIADISVTPTLYEGLPLVILEAMAAGKPIVASNVSEVPQVIKDGVNGYLVPPKDPRAIADAVLRIHTERLGKEFSKNTKEIIGDYDWKKIAQRALIKYHSLIENRL